MKLKIEIELRELPFGEERNNTLTYILQEIKNNINKGATEGSIRNFDRNYLGYYQIIGEVSDPSELEINETIYLKENPPAVNNKFVGRIDGSCVTRLNDRNTY